MCGIDFAGTLAVVPVFFNTGAALLPAIVAGLASLIAVLMKPSVWIRTCRERPYIPIGVVLVGVTLWFGVSWLSGSGAVADKAVAVTPVRTESTRLMSDRDWMNLARELSRGPTTRKPTPATTDGGEAAVPRSPVSESPAESLAEGPLYLGGGPQRSGHLGGPSPIDLQLAWSYNEYGEMFLSTPLVRDGRMYAASCLLDPPGSYGVIYCFDALSGRPIWFTDLKNATEEFKGFFSSPAITADGRSLIIGQGLHPDYDSELVCVDTENGSVRWLVPCPLHIESSPAIADGIVVVGAGSVEDPDTHEPKPHPDPTKDRNPGYVLAVRIATGEVLWQHVYNDPESSPAISPDDKVAYIGSGYNGNAVAALRVQQTDAELAEAGLSRDIWKTTTPFPATGAITCVGETVLVGCGNSDYVFQDPNPAGAVLAMDAATGKVRWKLDMPDGVLGSIAVRGRKAIIPVRNGEIIAIELPEGDGVPRELWRNAVREGSNMLAGCALTATHVYTLTHNGYLLVIDADSGKTLEEHYVNDGPATMGMTIASPVVANGRVYVGTETGGLRCYTDGRK